MGFDLEIINTRLDADVAEVTLQHLPDPLHGSTLDLRLEGVLTGPHCVGQETAVSTCPLASLPSEDGLVRCRASIPNPANWSPAAPLLYRAEVRLSHEGQVETERLAWGLKTVSFTGKGLWLNGEAYSVRGLLPRDPPHEATLAHLHELGVNLLHVPLSSSLVSCSFPRQVDELGFLVLYDINPEDEAALWEAEATLFNHVSTLGFVLPQKTMREPQLWHNAMLHLHGRRRDVYVGVRVDEVPVGLIQGHVDFLVAPPAHLAELVNVKTGKLALFRRGGVDPDELPPGLAGHISRTPPGE